MSVAILLVTCCLEQSRAEILGDVIKNLHKEAPELYETLTVFDNASTVPGTIDVLRDSFVNVYQSDKNVGYWSAIDWWLEHLASDPPAYTYIIESDELHYDFHKLWTCAKYLDENPTVGSCRLHRYSIANRHLFNKDAPRTDSNRMHWQSHTNRVTGRPVEFERGDGDVWSTTFLTQLPALNRYQTMRDVFAELRARPNFSELDFQALYWQRYQRTAILDGGIFYCDMMPFDKKVITGSWTGLQQLQEIGYQPTRLATITPRDRYKVSRV